MRRQWVGTAAAVLLLGSAGSALANQEQKGAGAQGSSQYQTSEHQKSASSTGQTSKQPATQAEHRLSGRVAAIKGDTLYLAREQAIIPLKVNQSTEVDGKPLMRSESINRQLSRDFPVGKEVRASFKIEDQTDNVAVSLDAAGMHHQGPQQHGQSQPSNTPSQGKK